MPAYKKNLLQCKTGDHMVTMRAIHFLCHCISITYTVVYISRVRLTVVS